MTPEVTEDFREKTIMALSQEITELRVMVKELRDASYETAPTPARQIAGADTQPEEQKK